MWHIGRWIWRGAAQAWQHGCALLLCCGALAAGVLVAVVLPRTQPANEAPGRAYVTYDRAKAAYRIACEGMPPFVHALDYAPRRREAFLNTGTWVVIAIAVWSSDDMLELHRVGRLASALNGEVNIGLRPFDSRDELDTWLPECRELHAPGTPIWIIMVDGRVVSVRTGRQADEAAIRWIRSVVSRHDTGAALRQLFRPLHSLPQTR
jgi:hypothetical protein